MIAYLCKYTPVEILEAFGASVKLVEPDVRNFTQADTLLHPNLCSFVKAVLEDFENSSYEGMVFTTCCDSVRRLYDTMRRRYPEKFFFCLDLPRKGGDAAVALYREQIERLMESYAAYSGKTFDENRLATICSDKRARREALSDGTSADRAAEGQDLKVCLAGARPGSAVKQLIEEHGAHIALDLTCTGAARDFAVRGTDRESILTSYTAALLGQIPCMRMAEVEDRAERILREADGLDGILYHTVKFCDIYSYEYTRWKETVDLPIVKLETDATNQCAGQILTRVEAFLESLRVRKQHPGAEGTPAKERDILASCDVCSGCPDGEADEARLSMTDIESDRDKAPHLIKGDQPMYVLGIDSGSTSTNAVLLNEKKEILSYAVLRTGAKSRESAERIRAEVLDRAHLSAGDLTATISTGYGRVSIPFADRNITEISCHARGAHFVNPAVRTILDIGGQDSKAIRLNENGEVIDFVMNDKCAAGTGRFLEMMAGTLEIGIEELGPLSLQSKEKVEISSMCSVFAESEVISLIAQNKEPADIARGIHRAIAGKALSLLKKVGPEPEFMMTGGVAKNPGMVAVLEEMLGEPLYIYREPEIVGALGAALYGLDE